MELMRKLGGLTLALALCAGLLAGCGSVADKSAEAAQAEETAETQEAQETTAPEEEAAEEAGEPEEAAEPEETSDAAFDEEGLTEALDLVANIGPGTAGSNLRAVRAAGELVVFSADNWNDETGPAIRSWLESWWEELPEEATEEFSLAWDSVAAQMKDIADRPWDPDIIGPLEDAGLPNLPLSAMDLTHTSDLVEAIGAIVAPNE